MSKCVYLASFPQNTMKGSYMSWGGIYNFIKWLWLMGKYNEWALANELYLHHQTKAIDTIVYPTSTSARTLFSICFVYLIQNHNYSNDYGAFCLPPFPYIDCPSRHAILFFSRVYRRKTHWASVTKIIRLFTPLKHFVSSWKILLDYLWHELRLF